MEKPVFMSKDSDFAGEYACLFRDSRHEYQSSLHYHDFYEFDIYLGRAGTLYIDGTPYEIERGDIALISMFTPHTLRYNTAEPYERFSVSIDPRLLLSFSSRSANILDIFLPSSDRYPLFHLSDERFARYLTLLQTFRSTHLAHGDDIFKRVLLLLSTNLPIARIAESVEFNNYSYFYKAFIKVYGMSPADYRRALH